MYKSNKSMLVSVSVGNQTQYRVVDYVSGVDAIKVWSTNLYRGLVATNTVDGYTTVNDKAPLRLIRDIADLIKW